MERKNGFILEITKYLDTMPASLTVLSGTSTDLIVSAQVTSENIGQ